MLWALAAAAMWAAYVVLGKRVARAGSGLDEMAVGFAVAAPALSLLGGVAGLFALADPGVLLLAVGVGVLSSVIVGVLSSVLPYALDQLVLQRVGQARFAVLLALLLATATVIGLVTLGQIPGVLEAVGIGSVIVAVGLRSRDLRRAGHR